MSAVRVVVACDKFKGSLTGSEVNRALATGLRDALPGATVLEVPIADGGDGTVAALGAAGFDLVAVTVSGPTGEPVRAHFALRGDLAVVELADACGLLRLPGGVLRPLTASSRGVGEAVLAALDAGARTVVLGLGGSASTDGGAGLLRALGARFYDASGADLEDGGAALVRLARVDLTGLDPRLAATEIVVACDVDNPLLGERGAVATFAPQKGAGPDDREALEAGLARLARVLGEVTGRDLSDRPGAGAAGGVGFGALAALSARVERGVDLLLDHVGLRTALAGADLVLTGEGSFDEQTLSGKAPLGVIRASRHAGVPVVVVCGRTTLAPDVWEQEGVSAVHPLTDLEADPVRCMADAATLLGRAATAVAAGLIRART